MNLVVALLLAQQDLTVLKTEDQPRTMLYRYLVGESAKKFDERRKAIETLKTPDDVRRRQAELHAKLLGVLGPFPEKTPLNARVTGTLKADGYRIEKLIYETRPEHYVPANLYVPDGKGPFPGVIFPLGHYGFPRAADEYQRFCILMAKNGFVVLTYDPVGQGERFQLIRPSAGPIAQGTGEHMLVHTGALLVGNCAATHFIWDGIRALDYLQSRPEVDPKRLGCTGNSGGGTLTSYLMAIDERIDCAVPNCHVTTHEKLLVTAGPQDGEANIPGLISFGMEHADFFLLRAPRPSQISCPTRDYYDIGGAWITFREAKRLYGILGHSEKMDLFEFDDKHSISKPFREADLRWMRRWLMGIDDATIEPETTILKEVELQCTNAGQIMREFPKARTSFDFNADREKELAPSREKLAKDDLLKQVRRLAAIDPPSKPATSTPPVPLGRKAGGVVRGTVYATDPGIQVPALLFTPELRKAGLPVLLAHGDGKSKGAVEAWLAAGREVTSIDLRGWGETEPETPRKDWAPFFRADWKEVHVALSLARPLLGQRARDFLSVISSDVHAVGVGAAAPVVLHAAAFDPRIREITLDGMVVSWSNVARTAVTTNQFTNVVPGALVVYDLPDLAAALAPRPLTIVNPVDAAGKPVAQEELDAAYGVARAAYAAAGAEKNLVLEAKK